MSTDSLLLSSSPPEEPTLNGDGDTPQSSGAQAQTSYSFSGSELKKETVENKSKDEKEKADEYIYECNICLDAAKDAVVSFCGHLFCWPCLYQWLQTRPNRKLCPVCKAAIGHDKVIPLYGRNSTKQEDPRKKVPPRPSGQRIEPEPQSAFQGFGFGDGGFHMSFGIGAFPFGYFASTFNLGNNNPTAPRDAAQYENEQQLSQLFLYLAFICIVWLLFA